MVQLIFLAKDKDRSREFAFCFYVFLLIPFYNTTKNKIKVSKCPDSSKVTSALNFIFSCDRTTIPWLQQRNHLKTENICWHCKVDMTLSQETDGYYRFRCNKKNCKANSLSLRKNTLFDEFSIPIHKVMQLSLFFWIQLEQTQTCLLTGLDPETVSKSYTLFRSSNELWQDTFAKKLTGEVEIDECAMFRRKYNRGRGRGVQWIFGMVERPKKPIKTSGCTFQRRTPAYMCCVAKRDRETLTTVIRRKIKKGSTIYSDGWGAYRRLREHQYQHYWVNHSKNFVDPATKCHSQRIESLWSIMRKHMPSHGVRIDRLNSYLADFCYRRQPEHNYDSFITFLLFNHSH